MAVPPLQALVAAGFDVALVVSQPDRRRGRGTATTPSPVKAAASELGLRTSDDPADAATVGADLGVVVAYGRILRAELLAALPMVNLHFSLLPRWRGAAPVERAILAGDAETGVCVMEVVEALDAGDVYAIAHVPIGARTTADELRAELVAVGTELLIGALADGLPSGVPQQGEPVYAHKLVADDLRLRWGASVSELDAIVRVGGAWTTFDGARFKVWDAAPVERADLAPGQLDGTVVGCGDGALDLLVVQPEGRARQAAAAWCRGARLDPDARLGS